MNETSMKGLPVNELSIVAVCVVIGFNPDVGENGVLETEMDVLNQKLWDTFKPTNKPNRCACCGHALKYACAVAHEPTGNGFWVGRDCAFKVERLRRFDAQIAHHTVAMAERIACNKREADFLAAHPDVLGLIAWAKLPRAPRIARDMLEKMRRFGDLSEKQLAALDKIKTQDEERRATATAKATAGRQLIKGTVVNVSVVEDNFNSSRKIAKVIVDLGTGVRLMGNLPEYVNVTELVFDRVPECLRRLGRQIYTHMLIKKGDVIELTATVTPSNKDDLFGFWKRPVKFSILSLAPPAPAPAPKVDLLEENRALFEKVAMDVQLLTALAANLNATLRGEKDQREELLCQAAERHNFTDEQMWRFVRAVINNELFKPVAVA